MPGIYWGSDRVGNFGSDRDSAEVRIVSDSQVGTIQEEDNSMVRTDRNILVPDTDWVEVEFHIHDMGVKFHIRAHNMGTAALEVGLSTWGCTPGSPQQPGFAEDSHSFVEDVRVQVLPDRTPPDFDSALFC